MGQFYKHIKLHEIKSCSKTTQHSHHERGQALAWLWLLREGGQAIETAALQAKALCQTSLSVDQKQLTKKNLTITKQQKIIILKQLTKKT